MTRDFFPKIACAGKYTARKCIHADILKRLLCGSTLEKHEFNLGLTEN